MERIGRYEIDAELGRGGMGVVYRAKDPAIGRTVAIKTIRLDDFTSESERAGLRERLFREARSAGALSHPNIITIYDMGEEEGIAYIAMEYIAGNTLEQLIARDGVLEAERVIPVLRQTAEALDYAARNGIVHRDIKPANIMLMEGSKVKVADFGVAKILSQQITKTDVVMGTPSYMSPEQIESKSLDGRSDQFALGVIVYELLTGEKPFVAESMASLVFQIARDEPVRATRLNPTLSSAVDSVIRRAMSKQPAMRFPNCLAFIDALADALAASAGWRPMARGASEELETLANTAVKSGAEVTAGIGPPKSHPAAPAVPRARRMQEGAGDTEPTNARAGRRWGLWLIGAITAASIAFMILGPRWPRQSPQTAVVSTVAQPVPESKPSAIETERPSTDVPKPSPLNTPPPSVAAPGNPPARPAPPSKPEPATVNFVSAPAGARVAVDGLTETCTTPCAIELPAGQRVIRFTLAGHRFGQAIIDVPGETLVNVTLDPLVGTLVIKSTPPGAQIILDGEIRTEVTPAILRLSVGKHRVVLRKAGSPDDEQDVEIKDQVITNVAVSWQ
jgi:serine/threonine-protein kinase